ncbi:oxidized low-density lipoprotein receptor 1-like, partial [Hypanus sabinus]|uniref:oxidized low-density lipoprotein receptor 1-like n=1 Tax=Hypanus sabinus TaxID=79690 RepID=UPI0028C4F047
MHIDEACAVHVTYVDFSKAFDKVPHVSQIRQSKVTSDRNYHGLNSTLQSQLSALNSNLSDLKRMHSDLRHQFTEMETKYRSVNETKAQICELLTSRREQTCPQNWSEKEDRCYFVSSEEKSYDSARGHCSNFDARLFEMNSNEEEDFVSISIGHRFGTYWIGKCRYGNLVSNLLYKTFNRPPTC